MQGFFTILEILTPLFLLFLLFRWYKNELMKVHKKGNDKKNQSFEWEYNAKLEFLNEKITRIEEKLKIKSRKF